MIRVFPVCYSDKHFGNSSPDNQHFIYTTGLATNRKFIWCKQPIITMCVLIGSCMLIRVNLVFIIYHTRCNTNNTRLCSTFNPVHGKCSKFFNTSLSIRPSQTEQTQISLLTVCYSDKHFVNSSPENQHLFQIRKRNVFEILEHLS